MSSSPVTGCEPKGVLLQLFARLDWKQRATQLPVLAKRLIVDVNSEIVAYDLNTPFTYLHHLVESNLSLDIMSNSSTWFRLGASPRGAPFERRSFTSNLPSNEFESPWVPASMSDGESFLTGLQFEQRNLLDGLPIDLGMG
jgi:hypothetical protein